MKTLNLYPQTRYIGKPIRTWADRFYYRAEEIPNAVDQLFQDFGAWNGRTDFGGAAAHFKWLHSSGPIKLVGDALARIFS